MADKKEMTAQTASVCADAVWAVTHKLYHYNYTRN